jgi:hypothetical protein
MEYGISVAGGSTPRKLDALNEAVRLYGALPFIQIIEYPEFNYLECLPGEEPYKGPQPRRITFKLERSRETGGLFYKEVK